MKNDCIDLMPGHAADKHAALRVAQAAVQVIKQMGEKL